MFGKNFSGNLKVDVVIWNGEVEAGDFGFFELRDARGFSEVLNEELVLIHERIVVKSDWVVPCSWKALVVAADVGNDCD